MLRARWAGNLIESALVHSELLVATVLSFSTEPESVNGSAAAVIEFEPNLQPADTVVRILSRGSGESKGA